VRRRWTSRTIDAQADRAWDLLVDLDRWPAWGPSVRWATLDDGGRRLVAAATGRVTPVVGPSLPFRVTELVEGRRWTWAVGGLAATSHSVEALGADRCRVAMGVAWPLAPYLAVCAVALRRIERLAAVAG
jgi:hypothetical protein